MNKREARKAALRLWAAEIKARSSVIRADEQDSADAEWGRYRDLSDEDRSRVNQASRHIAEHLEWEADGRPERT